MEENKPIQITEKEMISFFENFNVFEHKYCYKDYPASAKNYLLEFFQSNGDDNKQYWDIATATETFRTIEKVYHLDGELEKDYCHVLQATIEKMMGQYLNIDGIQDLFHASYFYFEWMMHLEYKEDRHSYSYYRDHYIHQVRNLFEMFILLDDCRFWENCMSIYKGKNNAVGRHMRNAVKLQSDRISDQQKESLGKTICDKETKEDQQKQVGDLLERVYYHYLIFASAILSALVHDIGYPIAYMNRTVGRLHSFLPISHLFIEIQNSMPRINSLLKDSLLFEVVDANEIRKRLEESDHGTYSAIILLYQYYDNGKIFDLSPIKRTVIELSALIIYNHTLHYDLQGAKKAHRRKNVYNENPLSYLFRLCDDLQEWERVYFEISSVSNFFVCDNCKMPMLRNLDSDQAGNIYKCFCGKKGINSNSFRYRRLLNVAPFKGLFIEELKVCDKTKERGRLEINLKSSKGALLQMAKYNPVFAQQRVEGLNEIKEMLSAQQDFPLVYLQSVITCNPIALKAKTLDEFLVQKELDYGETDKICSDYSFLLQINLENYEKIKETVGRLQRKIRGIKLHEDIYAEFCKISSNQNGEKPWPQSPRSPKWAVIRDSICFYATLILFGQWLRNERKPEIIQKMERDGTKEESVFQKAATKLLKERRENLQKNLNRMSEYWGHAVADAFHILDHATIVLISDYLRYAFSEVTRDEFFSGEYDLLYKCSLLSRKDMPDIIDAYTNKNAYSRLCDQKKRENSNKEMIFDYYSDYYFFYEMDRLCNP